MLTDIVALEQWLSSANSGDEFVFYEDTTDPIDLVHAADCNAGFAHCYELLKRAADGKRVYLSIDNMGRAKATMLNRTH